MRKERAFASLLLVWERKTWGPWFSLSSPAPFNGVYAMYTTLCDQQGASVPGPSKDGGLVQHMLYQAWPLLSPLVYMSVLPAQDLWPGQTPSAPYFDYTRHKQRQGQRCWMSSAHTGKSQNRIHVRLGPNGSFSVESTRTFTSQGWQQVTNFWQGCVASHRSFRDTLVVLFRTTFWEAAALILKDFDCRLLEAEKSRKKQLN